MPPVGRTKEIRINRIAFSLTTVRSQYGEYVVKVFRLVPNPLGGLSKEPLTERYYYTDSKEDAIGTLEAMAKAELQRVLDEKQS